LTASASLAEADVAITDEEIRMTIKTLASKGLAKRAITRQLSLSEGTVRYHLRRIAARASDGRTRQVGCAVAHEEATAHRMSARGAGALGVAALNERLMREHGHGGSRPRRARRPRWMGRSSRG
jgi:hypothetical protein